MNFTKCARFLVVTLTVFCLLLPMVYGQAAKGAKKEFNFKGKVEKINASTKILTVAGEDVPGWMGAMTMDYGVDKDDVLKKVKVGDQITAKVYNDDFKTLHDVQIAPPAAPKAAPNK